ncbi:MAG: hypothetical protein AAGB06_00535, partial [Verrucomicrobiota bacterium]
RSTIRFCFTQRRKQIGALLRKCPEPLVSENAQGLLSETRIDPTTRPEAVTIHQWRTFDGLVDRLKLPD